MPPSTHASTLLAPFQSLFNAPTWRKVQRLIVGTLLARGRRTVTAAPGSSPGQALRHTGQGDTPAFSLYHQVFNRARWSALKGSRCLLSLLVQTFDAAGGSLTFVIDETLERRWGRRINKRGHYRDPLASSRKRSVSTSGLRWIVLTLVLTPPWTTRCWALPIPGSSPGQALSVPVPTPQVSERLGLRHKTIAQWARQMIRVVRRWLPHVAITVLGDQAYSVVELAHACRHCGVRLIAPLRLDAVLHEAPPPRQPGTRGRPPLKGRRLSTLAECLHDAATPWQPLCVRWYDGRLRWLQVSSGTALWYRSGQPVLPLRWVLVRHRDAQDPSRAFFSTRPSDQASDMVACFIKRWSIETTFEESRAHLGFETQRQWSDLAIERTTPCLLSLYSLVALLAHDLYPGSSPGQVLDGRLAVRRSAWYGKEQATFSDALAAVRQQLWEAEYFPTSTPDTEWVEIPRVYLQRLMQSVCYTH